MQSDDFPRTGTVIQALRRENHVSLAIDWPDLPASWGERLRVQAQGIEAEVFYHGSMKVWTRYGQIFGRAAQAQLAADPGMDAYTESALTMGGVKIPGQQAWVRLRATAGGQADNHALFQLAPGTPITVSRTGPPVVPAKPKASKYKDGVIQAQVLASHPHSLILNVNLPLLRKLEAPPESWYEIEINGRTIPVFARRRPSLEQEKEIWSQPDTLLYDFESHWIFEKLTVMALAPMQMNWRGKFPEATEVTTETAQIGATIPLRIRSS